MATLPSPRIIPRPEHTISRKNIDPDALKVLYRLQRHGHTAYLVGGSVRDLLLGKKPKDFDISTDAHPGQIRRLFHNSRVIGRRFRLVQVFFHGQKIVEVSTFRKAGEALEPEEDEVLCANNTFGTPAEDALRRDLTINALFYDIADFSVVDYVGGLEDLQAGRIRAVGDAEVRFHRDPVRVLRAVRHAARTGFHLTEETLAAVTKHRDDLCLCPTSRIRDEFMRDLKGGAAAAWLELSHETGVLYSLLPTLEPFYRDPASPSRGQARDILGKVDQLVAAAKQPPEDAVVLAALFWPALREACQALEPPEGRSGRPVWVGLVRDQLYELASPVAFAKRVLDRMAQMTGVLWTVESLTPGSRLPKRVTDKGYFNDALALAELLDLDLAAFAGPPPAKSGAKKRRRRRRKKARPPAAEA
ncbi:MAG: polynucleotide adenylyltransferase PcnB [Deltaproteobacteria bacterium]|nr:polynucleotide adenylyltransferase PcnB [Deltaproteobacteria bacterium]